jgi:ubiquinone/menaquinone biosynthesis C-methylase UbiE
MKFLRKLADPTKNDSIATKTRQRNFELFRSLISKTPRPIKILDIGGTQYYWENVNFIERNDVKIVLLNTSQEETTLPNFKSVVGDARQLDEFKDKEFDIVFSHSVIEHVGGFNDQVKMSDEIRRIGKRYFLQTPNRFFPIEPHFLFPLFQFLPLFLKVYLVSHFDIGWYRRTSDKKKALELVNSIRLLTEKEVREMFPGATIYREIFMGLVKSFIVYDGWKEAPVRNE